MSTLTTDMLANPQDVYTSSSTQQARLGSLATTGDGRYFRYALAGGSSLVAGNLLQAPAQQSGNTQLTPAAASSGATSVTLTIGTTVTANQYAGGWLTVTADAGTNGLKQTNYQISSHPAVTAGGGATCTFTLADPIVNLITTSAKVDLSLMPYNGVIQNPTTGTGTPVGIATFAITNAQYGWIQVLGPCAILNDAGGAITVGNTVVPSTTVAGAVKSATGTLPVVGTAMTSVTASSLGTFYVNGLV